MRPVLLNMYLCSVTSETANITPWRKVTNLFKSQISKNLNASSFETLIDCQRENLVIGIRHMDVQ
jgi:hypothetical protein